MKKKGFTLIEIMTVVAIIAILVGIAIAAGDSAKKTARDNQRRTDISLLQLKLEAYKGDHGGSYPATLSALVSNYVPSLPVDPTNNGGGYQYIPLQFSGGTCGIGYYLDATLENNNSDKTSTNYNYNRGIITTDNLSSCGPSLPTISFPTSIYDVVSPNILSIGTKL